MRILIVHNEYRQPGGEERAVQNQERLLRARGHETVVFKKRSADWAGLSFGSKIASALEVPFSQSAYREIKAVIERTAPDVVHAHNVFPFVTSAVYEAAGDSDVPVVQTLHNFRFTCISGSLFRDSKPCELCVKGNSFNGIWHRCYQKSALKSALMTRAVSRVRSAGVEKGGIARYIALSEFSRRKLAEAGLPADKIDVIPNPVPQQPEPLSAAPSQNSLVFVGRLSEEKGVLTLLQGYKNFSSRYSGKVPLDIVGDGPLMPQVKMFKDQHPDLNIHLHGFLTGPAKDDILRSASFSIFPSECYENCPYAVLESLAFGVPVIGSQRGGIPELVRERETGYLFSSGSPDALGDCLLRAFNELDVWPALRKSSWTSANHQYGEEKWINSLEGVYASACRTLLRAI